MSSKRLFMLVTAVLALVGCSTTPLQRGAATRTTSPSTVDDMFSQTGLTVAHTEIYVHGTLREEQWKHDAISGIIAHLEGRSGGPGIKYEYRIPSGDIRTRDYWAAMLSFLTGAPLHLFLSDSDPVRDKKIADFLSALHNRNAEP